MSTAMADRIDCVTLVCREGNANKQYTAWLEKSGGGFTVQFQYGPVGGWVQGGTKTPKPAPEEKARKIYEKVLAEKRAKGYTSGDAPAFSQTDGAKDTGIRPMLLTQATEDDLERFVTDNAWGAQEKLNGKRMMVKIDAGKVTGINRRGLECPIPSELQDALKDMGSFLLDGELVGTTYHMFDVLAAGPNLSEDHRQYSIGKRCGVLDLIVISADNDLVKRVPLIEGTRDKRKLVSSLKEGCKEGVVFKKLDAPYVPGRIENLKKALAVKVKFYAEGCFQVIRWNSGKSSIEVGAYDADENLVSVGNVTVPAKYAKQIGDGDVVRVKYLYATSADQLYQPRLDPDDAGHVTRDDVDRKDCLIASLKHEGKEEE